nr:MULTISPECIES: G1 family glutamic endopeptidase [unclassified Paenibacillus]
MQAACRGKKNSPVLANAGWTSSNWSGYAATGSKGAFRSISASWTVPFVLPSERSSYSSAWIGIDGYNNSSLIQTGTEHECVNGKANYYAWWEILPRAETRIRLPVFPGDLIEASIVKLSLSKWLIRLRNVTRGWLFRTVQAYKGPQTSAEWIVEAPAIGGAITRMARLTPTAFRCCRLNGRNPELTGAERGIMVQNGIVTAIPSRPNRAGDAFLVRSVRLRMPAADVS